MKLERSAFLRAAPGERTRVGPLALRVPQVRPLPGGEPLGFHPKSLEREREDLRLGVEVAAIHAESKRRYGSPRVHDDLRARGRRVGRKRVARLMHQRGLRARTQRRRWLQTTDSRQPAREPRVPSRTRCAWCRREHESKRRLLRQRRGGELLLDPRVRARRRCRLADARPGCRPPRTMDGCKEDGSGRKAA
jgi:transposase InsO family protein